VPAVVRATAAAPARVAPMWVLPRRAPPTRRPRSTRTVRIDLSNPSSLQLHCCTAALAALLHWMTDGTQIKARFEREPDRNIEFSASPRALNTLIDNLIDTATGARDEWLEEYGAADA
jgi:hypothetical protein